MSRTTVDKSQGYRWVTWLRSHHRSEFARILRYGTPSDELVALAEFPVLLRSAHESEMEWVEFPLSLSRRSGQALLFETAKQVDSYMKSIPMFSWTTVSSCREISSTRRTWEMRRSAELVAEAILYRAAVEFVNTVLCAYSTIQTWISKAHGVELSLLGIGNALRWWSEVEGSPFSVLEWGQRGGFGQPTRIRIRFGTEVGATPSPTPEAPARTSPRRPTGTTRSFRASQEQADEWVLSYAHAMNAVYRLQDELKAHAQKRRKEQGERKSIEHAQEKEAIRKRVTEHLRAGQPLFGTLEDLVPAVRVGATAPVEPAPIPVPA
ncbi:hypothetical protein ACFO1B_03785 [Dactylosporangium siamense]|uniref:Uncharacterized protein n=1 Tax=Dactylosporangium siamense TaxID=685454 RepID=A0A919PF20_9ACTN|nr:hypothetical protein [Dactylosporangium siamense]GIG42997.1 hypothetical protein Dsi01nite_010380 [Dactylosporangium siamense]